MKRIRMISIILIICFALGAGLCACDSLEFDFKDYDDFKESTKNYSMTISNNDETIIIKVCENGYLYDNGSSIYFYNNVEKKGYALNKTDNTGVVNTYEDGENLYDWEDGGFIDMLYSFQILKLFMKKEGTEKIAGRDCTIYTYNKDDADAKYWLDNEFGMCLKSENTEDGETDTMEVTEFTLGDVTLDNMIDLSTYTITDGSIVPVKTVVSISVKNDTIPTNKTPNSFVLSDIKITVNYEDSTHEDISLTESMLSVTDRDSLNTVGVHNITVSYQGKTASFSITLVAIEKTVLSIEVKSDTIPVGKTTENFVLSDIKITVNYEDSTHEDISLTESMLSATDRDRLKTAGEHNITVNFQAKTASFTVTLMEDGPINSPIYNSIQNFYSNIALDVEAANGFIPTLAMNISIIQPEFQDYYYQSVEGRADIDLWSAPNLLLDASSQIMAYLEGNFDTEEIDFGEGVQKTPSCIPTANGYTVKYIETKGLYRYWFETVIEYDETTDSLSAEIYCGVNESQELKYIIEYNKTENGNYMCLIHFPNEIIEGNSISYTTLKLYFKGVVGKVSINRWQEEALAETNLVFEKEDNALYADDGDAVIITDGEAVTCPIDNLNSGFHDDFNGFFTAITDNRESIFDEESEEESYISFGNNSEWLIYTIEEIYAGDYLLNEIIKSYDNKTDIPIPEGVRLVINCIGDTYIVSYENEYEEIIITVKYDISGSFCIEKEVDGVVTLRFQWVQIGAEHFIEVLENNYGTFTQYKYTFNAEQNTMKFVCIYEMSEGIDTNIYKATNLTATTFAAEPNSVLYPYYEHYSFASGSLVYNFSFGE